MKNGSAATVVRVQLSHPLIESLDDFRRREPDLPSRPQAVRRLMRMSFAAQPIAKDMLRLVDHLRSAPGYDGSLDKHMDALRQAAGVGIPD